ncbi:Glutamate/glutamine/aspartate/asparagine transport system permease protein BztC [Nymphon striatum]|nr:Glutamate/glutamine/aspartate/asparagine transport system permease protein BztC [Nymphon striatum]
MATVLGVTVGVLRLSNNWLVRKLTSGYVEIFRNVPVLIWILIIMALFVAVLPQPRDFRGEDAVASMKLWDSFAFTGRGFYSPKPVFGEGSWLVIGYFILSLVCIWALRKYAKRMLFDHGRVVKTFLPSVALFFVPVILVYFATGQSITLEYPELKGFNFKGGIFARNSLIALWFALSIYTAAFIAENVRAGILAVSKGQTEAAASLGLRPNRIMNLVVLPQALRVIIPPLISPVSEPDQELFAGDCCWVYGSDRDFGWYHVEPDRSRYRMRSLADDVLSDNQFGHFGDHERLQQFNQTEGALRSADPDRTVPVPRVLVGLGWNDTDPSGRFGRFCGWLHRLYKIRTPKLCDGFVGWTGWCCGHVVARWLISGALPGFLALEAVVSRDMGGFMLNMILGVVCVSLSLPLGILLALGRQSDMPIIKWICVVFIEFIRGVPLITLLFVANVVLAYFLPPGTNFDLILRVIIMITMFSAAYIAEVIRGGLAALPRGQYEAADSLGLNYAQATRLIIMPQALKISIPGIVNVAVGLFKDTVLVSVISMFDLVGMIRGPILASTEWNGVYWELWGFAVVLFFVVCYGISQYSQWLERQLATDHR